jgi:hypothetical protein
MNTKQDEKRNVQLDGLYHELIHGLLMTDNSSNGDDENVLWESIVEDTAPVSEWNRRLGDKLREKRLSADTMVQLVERLYERQMRAEKRIRILSDGGGGGGAAAISLVGDDNRTATTMMTMTTKDNVGFKIGDRSNSREYLEREFYVLQWFLDRILGAQALLDDEEQHVMGKGRPGSTNSKSSSTTSTGRGVSMALEARLRELKRAEEQEFQRKIAIKLSDGRRRGVDSGMASLVSETMGERNVTIKIDGKEISGSKVNITRLMEDIVQVPMWVPSSILPFLIVYRTELDSNDLKKIKTQVLSGSQFHVDNWDFTRIAAIYRGSFVSSRRGSMYKTNSVGNSKEEMTKRRILMETSFQDIQKRLGEAGLADRIQLFLMEDPEWRPGSRDPEPLPSILAVSSDVKPEQVSERGKATKFLTVSVVNSLLCVYQSDFI